MSQNMLDSDLSNNRNQKIMKVGKISIFVNVILAFVKAIIGMISHSISITLDAINNLSDAISGIVTIVGAKLSNKQPDAKHPFGYGRIEYISALLVAELVLYAGITSLVESVKKIFNPSTPSYSQTSLFILGIFIVVKLLLSNYVKKKGKQFNSMSLIASGKDAGFDAILSLSVLISIFIYLKTGLLLEAYLGTIISIIIIKSGIEMVIDTIDEVLGKRVDKDLSEQIKQDILKHEHVLGVYDLIINSYGPDTQIGSVHIEVKDTMQADEIDLITRKIAYEIYETYGILLTGIGIYSKNTTNNDLKKVQTDIEEIVMSFEGVLQMHAFYMDEVHKLIVFDIIIDYNLKNRDLVYDRIMKRLTTIYPDYKIYINMDIDI